MSFNQKIRNSLVSKVLFSVGAVLSLAFALWGYFYVRYITEKSMSNLTDNLDRLGTTIRLGLQYAMMLNSRHDIEQIINNIARQNDIENIRIYNKNGEIKYSNDPLEVNRLTNIKARACYVCHKSDPPTTNASLTHRVRLFQSAGGYRLMGIISPVYNEQGCSTDSCHVHPPGKRVLGALDLVVSLKDVDREIASQRLRLAVLAVVVFLATAGVIIFIIVRFVTTPVNHLIRGAHSIERGDYETVVKIDQEDEMKELARAINQMGRSIGEKTAALNKQRDEFQVLFETVPCIISVQDLDYRLIGYNQAFADRFEPRLGEYCFKAYKGRDEKCVVCPVEKTFADGQSHHSEESAVDKDGVRKHWIVRTSPIKDANGRIVAAMEMNLDISEHRRLEEKLEQSEKKYHAIFNNIPNPVFVLDPASLMILDCNDSVAQVYGYGRDEMIGKSFFSLFWDPPDERSLAGLTTRSTIESVKHRRKDDQQCYVTVLISPSEYGGRRVLLVTISDITKRLQTEQQLIQASKMATLGEMATGVAHELNQPLSVIKTASGFFMRKIRKKEPIAGDVLLTMAEEIDKHVVRATKIINHMRQFGRKSDNMELQAVQIREVVEQAFEIFSRQLKVRGIEVAWRIDPTLPCVMADAGRLEQVIINLLLNARDAIEQRWESAAGQGPPRRIDLAASRKGSYVALCVCDTGVGIPEGYLDKIFEPFFTTKKVGRGTGLGLSISYGIIQEFNGRIYARGNPEGGACFVIELPVAPNDNEVS